MTRRQFLGAAAAMAGSGSNNADAVCGTWSLQQAASMAEFDRLTRNVSQALTTPHLRGFCLRAPWRAVDEDFSLFEAGWKLASDRGLAYSVRFMAGRHTPERVFEAGSPFYRNAAGEKVPTPYGPDGAPNLVFEREFRAYTERLAEWCRSKRVRLLHLAWYGQDWAELNHGKEVRAAPGYSYGNWLTAHRRLLDIGLDITGDGLACELPLSGYGPLTDAAEALADHVVKRIGPANPSFFCQANGWGPGGDWGAPTARLEAAFDKVWSLPICRGQQSIQPRDFDWASLFDMLYANRATYCEIYVPSFLGAKKDQLAEEVRKFAEHCKRKTPLPLTSG